MFPSFASHFPFVKGDGLQNPNFDPLLPCLDLNSHGLQDHNFDPNFDPVVTPALAVHFVTLSSSCQAFSFSQLDGVMIV
jgi:hypothetical protein